MNLPGLCTHTLYIAKAVTFPMALLCYSDEPCLAVLLSSFPVLPQWLRLHGQCFSNQIKQDDPLRDMCLHNQKRVSWNLAWHVFATLCKSVLPTMENKICWKYNTTRTNLLTSILQLDMDPYFQRWSLQQLQALFILLNIRTGCFIPSKKLVTSPDVQPTWDKSAERMRLLKPQRTEQMKCLLPVLSYSSDY